MKRDGLSNPKSSSLPSIIQVMMIWDLMIEIEINEDDGYKIVGNFRGFYFLRNVSRSSHT